MDKFPDNGSSSNGAGRVRRAPWRRVLARRCVLGLSLMFTSQAMLAQALYRITDLGTLGGTDTYGATINSKGQATGYSYLSGDGVSHAYFWPNNGKGMRDLGGPGANSSGGLVINDSGQIAGQTNFSSGATHAFVWKNNGTALLDLGILGTDSSWAVAINASGQVAGFSDIGGNSHPFLWKNDGTPIQDLGILGPAGGACTAEGLSDAGEVTGDCEISNTSETHVFIWKNDGSPMQDLGTLGGPEGYAFAMNKSGQITGGSRTKANTTHAFFWKNDGGPLQDIGDLFGNGSYGTAINDAGQVTGYGCTAKCFFEHAFLWKNDGTPMVDLGTLGGNYSSSVAINNSGQVVGTSHLKGNTIVHIFLWRNDGTKLQDVNALIDPTDPLKPYAVLANALDINDAGQILAAGTDNRTGASHAYLLTGTVVTVSPRALAFGNQAVGTSSAAKSVTVTNTSPKAVAITGLVLAGANANQFVTTNNCGKSLAGHAACTAKVIFKPTTKGAKTGTLSVNGGGGGLRVVSLTGTGS